jgi:hypothetical protein
MNNSKSSSPELDRSVSGQTVYCPYTDKDIPAGQSSPEHIIPMALRGLNTFALPVSATFNSEVGSRVDGILANDFLIMSLRDKYRAKGHNRQDPEFVCTHASDALTGDSLRVTLGQRRNPGKANAIPG